jgi:hypothetical protein
LYLTRLAGAGNVKPQQKQLGDDKKDGDEDKTKKKRKRRNKNKANEQATSRSVQVWDA